MSGSNHSSWIGKSETRQDIIRPEPARFMQATLGLDERMLENGDTLPPLWHWLYFLNAETRSRLGRDGHPRRGGFLPPIDLPRRMWAGGRFDFETPLPIGVVARKVSTIVSVNEKSGRSGLLCFVTVRHEIGTENKACLTEEHDIVYRSDPDPDASLPALEPKPAPVDADITETIEPDPVLLFRYSALTFNGHRIHYDRDYSRNVEGYPELVFHGPLTATLLAGLAMRAAGGQALKQFSFRAIAPLFVDRSFTINARKADDQALDLWATTPDGAMAVSARAVSEPRR